MNIKNITFGIFCVGVLFSCTKEDMEVQKNTDLTWEINQDLVNEDIRTSIGYDPRHTYVYPNVSTIEYSVAKMEDLVLPAKGEKYISVSIAAGKIAKSDIKVTLEYNPSLFDELKNVYGGYELGDESLVKIDEKQKTISAGESSANFQLSGNFYETKKFIVPYSIKIESEEDVSFLGESNQLVVKSEISNFLDNTLVVNKSKCSSKFSETFEKLKSMPISSKKFSRYSLFIDDNITFEKLDKKNIAKLVVYINGNKFECKRYIDLSDFTLKDVIEGDLWNTFGPDLDNIIGVITSNAPYKYEEGENSTVKVISVKDPDMWFTMEKQ